MPGTIINKESPHTKSRPVARYWIMISFSPKPRLAGRIYVPKLWILCTLLRKRPNIEPFWKKRNIHFPSSSDYWRGRAPEQEKIYNTNPSASRKRLYNSVLAWKKVELEHIIEETETAECLLSATVHRQPGSSGRCDDAQRYLGNGSANKIDQGTSAWRCLLQSSLRQLIILWSPARLRTVSSNVKLYLLSRRAKRKDSKPRYHCYFLRPEDGHREYRSWSFEQWQDGIRNIRSYHQPI
jgi:hypothetical protein